MKERGLATPFQPIAQQRSPMASVSSLDKDMRNIRLSRYTPQAANESRVWIEEALGERLQPGDLLEALKDGAALCKYVGAFGKCAVG